MGIARMSCLCLRHRVKIIILVISACAFVTVVFLYKSEESHARRRLGPQPLTEYHNPLASTLLRERFVVGRNGTKIWPADLTEEKLYGKEGQELLKERERLTILEHANVSMHNDRIKGRDSVVGIGSHKKYEMRAEVRKVLEQRTVNGTRRDRTKQTCLVPELNPFDGSIQAHIKEPKPLNCEGIRLTEVKNRRLVLRKSVTRKIKYRTCYVSAINRVNDFLSLVSSPSKVNVDYNPRPDNKDIPLQYNLSSDFTVVVCLDEKGNLTEHDFDGAFTDLRDNEEFDTFYKASPALFDVHASVVPKPKVLQRLRDTKPPRDGLGVNVVMLALEATSRMNFLRQLPLTTDLLAELGSVFLEGYNIVADATAGALIPMLTGKTELELPEIRKGEPGSSSVDAYPLIWKEFAKSGYATMFAEDSPRIATFNLRFNGFDEQPTDHYMRTFWNAAQVRNSCLGPRPVHSVMLDHLFDYMVAYKDKPHFAFTFLVGLTHANINPLRLMDEDLHGFLVSAYSRRLLNNTVLFMFGDHGSRYSAIRKTLQGKLEERLPFMSVTLPDWMPKRYPDIAKNLRANTKRLATPFDVHQTLRSVLHYSTKPVSVRQRAISLFSEIPRERTCDHAHVAAHWCSCLTWEPAGAEWAGHLASALVEGVNAKTEPVRHKCAKLRLNVALNAERMVPNEQVLRFVDTSDNHREANFHDNATVRVSELPVLYQVTVETMPGNGLFEGTVRVLPQSKADFIVYEPTGDISRINRYGTQADCLRHSRPNMMPFCYCKDNQSPKRKM
ncbi:uncharacterized protein LOC110980804 [Acanthaster planci]|uniref:Uncharacterized protein LOC110980804 n=1 Tax=Acanthaster planci TaxID=133434 RepID=A0A8B7YLH1_ACAPL|nr:uncharacterized protein LOC110980804 [Acanthaster planci]XP_022093485.1 uncharacterized protein LOC110980804 [Acanthaster planci]XP_022093486.1 uncharacterized protein LOC110980804 [Acanthaster planci]XP_022093487.1 uncharacterized protein LOC110980804 [Acanthaster planci]XP_022093488.1 uncharacterized protein LOC110980804 [Acanthaster planci]